MDYNYGLVEFVINDCNYATVIQWTVGMMIAINDHENHRHR